MWKPRKQLFVVIGALATGAVAVLVWGPEGNEDRPKRWLRAGEVETFLSMCEQIDKIRWKRNWDTLFDTTLKSHDLTMRKWDNLSRRVRFVVLKLAPYTLEGTRPTEHAARDAGIAQSDLTRAKEHWFALLSAVRGK